MACGQEGRVRRSGDSSDDDEDASSSASSSASASGVGGAGGSGGAGGPDVAPQPLKILNWNTYNFFNDKNDDASQNEIVISASNYTAKRASIAAIVNELDADVAMLLEIENESVLKDLNADLAALGGGYAATTVTDTFDTRELAVLSKLPIESVVSHKDEKFKVAGTNGPLFYYTRDCLEVHVTFNGRPVVLLGVHFRSKVDPDDPDKRLAEAQHTREIANGIAASNPGAAVVVLGDFNDVPGSKPVEAVRGTGEGAFVDAPALVEPATSAWSYSYQGQKELIDHQFSNPLLAGMLAPESIIVLHRADAEDASDHAPVMATYQVH